MKKTRKVLALALTLVLALGLLSVNAFADDTNTLTVEAASVTAAPGSTVDVAVKLTANPGVVALSLGISYDESVLTLNSVTDKELFKEEKVTNTEINMKPSDENYDCYVLFDGALNSANVTATGDLLVLNFTVNKDAEEGDYSIDLTIADTANNANNTVTATATNGKITVANYMKGDVMLDGDVDMDDVVVLMRHVLQAELITDKTALANGEVINEESLDMDDVVKIMRYVLKAIDTLD